MRGALGFLGDWGVALLSLAYVLALGPLVPGLLSAPNLGNVLSNVLPLLAVALGQTLVLVTGGIDLSVTATVALASVAGAKVMTEAGEEIPLSEAASGKVYQSRHAIEAILDSIDGRLLVVVGPCSIHDDPGRARIRRQTQAGGGRARRCAADCHARLFRKAAHGSRLERAHQRSRFG